MRAKSKKRAARERGAKPFRDGLIEQVGRCERCGCSPGNRMGKMPQLARLCVHEVANGPLRQKAIDKPFAVLVLCWECNGDLDAKGVWPEARQLSLLAKSRPRDFDLVAYLDLTSPNAPRRILIEEVVGWMEGVYLSKQEVADYVGVDRRSVQNWIDAGDLQAMDARMVWATKPLYRIAWEDFLDFCERRRVAKEA